MKILILFFVLVSCKPQSLVNHPFKSCKEFCSPPGSDPDASIMVDGDIRCHRLDIQTLAEGQKKGICDDGSLTTERKAKHPDPDKCQALRDAAKKKCDALTPDPSMMNQMVSGAVFFKKGEPVRINGKVCTCDKTQATTKSKTSPGQTTTTEKPPHKAASGNTTL